MYMYPNESISSVTYMMLCIIWKPNNSLINYSTLDGNSKTLIWLIVWNVINMPIINGYLNSIEASTKPMSVLTILDSLMNNFNMSYINN